LRLALAIVATGLITALLVIATVLYAFQRFERETTFQRANTFLARIASNVELLELHERLPHELNTWMRSVMLYEPDSQLYLLDAQGTVLSSTGQVTLAPGFKVALAPVQAAAQGASGPAAMPYVMGDDPERMALDTVVAARPLRRAVIRSGEPVSGYLYLVSRRQELPGSRWQALRSSFAFPVLLLLLGIVVLTTGLAAAIIAAVTRPLQRLTAAVAGISLTGLEQGGEPVALVGGQAGQHVTNDQFPSLHDGVDGHFLAGERTQAGDPQHPGAAGDLERVGADGDDRAGHHGGGGPGGPGDLGPGDLDFVDDERAERVPHECGRHRVRVRTEVQRAHESVVLRSGSRPVEQAEGPLPAAILMAAGVGWLGNGYERAVFQLVEHCAECVDGVLDIDSVQRQ
ncbi:MAG: hypothetical protein ABMA25_15895, partial [Ilumatobacteraceae bacterium]